LPVSEWKPKNCSFEMADFEDRFADKSDEWCKLKNRKTYFIIDNRFIKVIKPIFPIVSSHFWSERSSTGSCLFYTVKLGYKELGYNELPVIVNTFKQLVWFSIFCLTLLSVIANKIPDITNFCFNLGYFSPIFC
jgi:hypothetical protein